MARRDGMRRLVLIFLHLASADGYDLLRQKSGSPRRLDIAKKYVTGAVIAAMARPYVMGEVQAPAVRLGLGTATAFGRGERRPVAHLFTKSRAG